MKKQAVLLCFIAVVFFLSGITWPYQNLFHESWYGISFIQLYVVLSLLVVAGLLLSLVKYNKRIILYFLCVFFSWFLVWSSWKDTLPPKTYFPLNDNANRYRIEKGEYYYGLCYAPEKGEKQCGMIGSSVYPLDIYIDTDVVVSAQWRSDWGKPMCHTMPCPSITNTKGSVIDILDIRLGSQSAILK